MRCSSCEPLFDRYVEGTLTAHRMRAIAAHLRACAPCRALLDELKVLDGLLATRSVAELPQNFTFAVMAETNTMPAPRERQHRVWSFLALYSAAAWVAAILAMTFTGTGPRAVITPIWLSLERFGTIAGALATRTAHGVAQGTPALAAFGVGVLFVDIALAGAVAFVYFVVRPRLAARLASVPEVL